MKVTKWEVSPLDEIFGSTRAEIARERGEVLTPPCKNENHNLFWEQFEVGPTDSYSTVAEYGITEERQCLRCQRFRKDGGRPSAAKTQRPSLRCARNMKSVLGKASRTR